MENRQVWIYGGIGVIVVGVLLAWFMLSGSDDKKMAADQAADQKMQDEKKMMVDADRTVPKPEPAPTTEPMDLSAFERSGMRSDEYISKEVKMLTADAGVQDWLAAGSLAARIVSLIDHISRGEVPYAGFRMLAPSKPFRPGHRRGRPALNAVSYRRYRPLASLVSSLDAHKTVELLENIRLTLDSEYASLGLGGSFQSQLKVAIDRVLAVRVTEANIPIKRDIVIFKYRDAKLEAASDLRRFMYRMGPDNSLLIQEKLKEIRGLLK